MHSPDVFVVVFWLIREQTLNVNGTLNWPILLSLIKNQ